MNYLNWLIVSCIIATSSVAQNNTYFHYISTPVDYNKSISEMNNSLRWYADQKAKEEQFNRQLQLDRDALNLQSDQFNRQLELQERQMNRNNDYYDTSTRTYTDNTQEGEKVSERDNNDPLSIRSPATASAQPNEEIQRLREENSLLKDEMREIKELLRGIQAQSYSNKVDTQSNNERYNVQTNTSQHEEFRLNE